MGWFGPRRDMVAPLDGVRHGPSFVGNARDTGSLCSANYGWKVGAGCVGRSHGMFGAFASIVQKFPLRWVTIVPPPPPLRPQRLLFQ
jgi:hypothetical protein